MFPDAFTDSARWHHATPACRMDDGVVHIETTPGTDLWQRTYYGFRVDKAPALLRDVAGNFTLTVRTRFDYRRRYDQCGILLRHGDDWFKASIEHEDATTARLGSVLTTRGYSDWATTDIPGCAERWYRLSRRGPDFRLEQSSDGAHYAQMRVFHLHALGETDLALTGALADEIPAGPVQVGVYACSPEDSCFTARFDRITLEPSRWQAHA